MYIDFLYLSGLVKTPLIWDMGVSTLVLGAFSFGVIRMLRYYHPEKQGWVLPLAWCAGMAVLFLLITLQLSERFLYGADRLSFLNNFDTSREASVNSLNIQGLSIAIRLIISFLVLALVMVLDRVMRHSRMEQEQSERMGLAEKLQREAELTSLRQQLQPHFIFNTLNSILSLIESRPDLAQTMVLKLSDFLRSTLKKDDLHFVTLGSELELLEMYLDIEKVRFGDRLQVLIESEPHLNTLLLPPLMLQPLVENAVKHGIYDTLDVVSITISLKKTGGNLQVVVTNPYDRTLLQTQKGAGFGLTSIERRLYLLFNRSDLITLSKSDSTYSIIVLIPQLNV